MQMQSDLSNISQYYSEINRIPLLKGNEEFELARLISLGNKLAKDRLVKANLRFVIKIAKEYSNSGVSLEDLVNEGNIGLITAAERFDSSRGFKFISYAVWWVRQAITQYITEKSKTVRIPVNRQNDYVKVKKFIDSYVTKFGFEPSLEEMEAKLDISKKSIILCKSIVANEESLDFNLFTDKEFNKHYHADYESDSPETKPEQEALKKELYFILKDLKAKEQEIIRLYFGIDCEREFTLEEIAAKYSLTRERVRQIKEKALSRLRVKSRADNIKFYLN
jgi:RNA polymerase primary sigma factor